MPPPGASAGNTKSGVEQHETQHRIKHTAHRRLPPVPARQNRKTGFHFGQCTYWIAMLSGRVTRKAFQVRQHPVCLPQFMFCILFYMFPIRKARVNFSFFQTQRRGKKIPLPMTKALCLPCGDFFHRPYAVPIA